MKLDRPVAKMRTARRPTIVFIVISLSCCARFYAHSFAKVTRALTGGSRRGAHTWGEGRGVCGRPRLYSLPYRLSDRAALALGIARVIDRLVRREEGDDSNSWEGTVAISVPGRDLLGRDITAPTVGWEIMLLALE